MKHPRVSFLIGLAAGVTLLALALFITGNVSFYDDLTIGTGSMELWQRHRDALDAGCQPKTSGPTASSFVEYSCLHVRIGK